MNVLKKDIFHNCIDVKVLNNKMCPIRFSNKQMDFYKEYKESFMIRSFCPSGICIKGKTNSTFLKIKFSIEKGKCREWAYFDLVINGILAESSLAEVLEEGIKQTITFDLSKYLINKDELDVTIYLPHSVGIFLHEIDISEQSYFNNVSNADKKIMCYGDSITQGMNAKHPSSTYPVLLSNYYNMELINSAIGGFVFDEDSLDENSKFKPDIITVAYGTNDWNKNYTIIDIEKECYKYLKKLQTIYNKSKIYVISPFWRADFYEKKTAGTLFDVINIINKVCQVLELEVLNGFQLIPNMCEYFGDGKVHPNDEGFLHIAYNLSKKLNY
ncbi:SGNH/GDSL hydrolase family protein [Vallitalea sp.]|jgi:hypothetical protein|uniref:SGNH/GDSL hydrolase family protein n=1 Tax=Vallitalea sp. TaxID=1882829 RepID=UPI0025CBAAC8|nr:SGNH/GDSL hydrolase family protein [Vallitalea sp.]MCT4688626.1 SGNH/GDSL hydrolase family protein [Vallitalea sp.]